MTPRATSEDGVAATQLAVVMPALLLLVMLAVQFGLWAHGSQLADAAADAAVSAASVVDGTDEAGRVAAAGLLAQAGHLADVAVEVQRVDGVVMVTVRGVAPQVVPGFRWSVSGRAAAVVEQFVPQGER